jgi:hypothetical protein
MSCTVGARGTNAGRKARIADFERNVDPFRRSLSRWAVASYGFGRANSPR